MSYFGKHFSQDALVNASSLVVYIVSMQHKCQSSSLYRLSEYLLLFLLSDWEVEDNVS